MVGLLVHKTSAEQPLPRLSIPAKNLLLNQVKQYLMILPWLISRIVLSGNHIGLKKIDIFPVLGHPCLKDHKLKKIIILSVICKMFTVPLVCGEAGSGESSGPLLFVDGACLLEGVCTVFGFPITMRLKHSSIKHCKLSKSSSFSRVLK